MPTIDFGDWFGYEEGAKRLGCSVRHLRRLVHDRKISFARDGKRVKFRQQFLDDYMSRRTIVSSPGRIRPR